MKQILTVGLRVKYLIFQAQSVIDFSRHSLSHPVYLNRLVVEPWLLLIGDFRAAKGGGKGATRSRFSRVNSLHLPPLTILENPWSLLQSEAFVMPLGY